MAQQQPPPRSVDPRLVALAAAYQAQTLSLRTRIDDYVRALWRSFRRKDDAALNAYRTTVAPVITGAQIQMASLTAAFAAHQREIALGTPFKPVAVDPLKVSGSAVRNGVPLNVVNARPFHVAWYEMGRLPRGDQYVAQALTSGETRAASIAATDLQLAKTHAHMLVTQEDPRASYTRRILEGDYSCGLCIVASTQRYKVDGLMPIHPGCDCGEETVYADQDPGQIIDVDSLQDVHDRIESRFGTSSPSAVIPADESPNAEALRYRDLLVTHEHGELGPLLGIRGQRFSDLDDLTST